jgi:hypothetical protein
MTKQMSTEFLEAFVSMLPVNAGGRSGTIAPRHGSYRPFARCTGSGHPRMLRIRFIEGPPRLAPGDSGSVVVELESEADLIAGMELEIVEHDGRVVGLMTVLRMWRSAVAV